MNRKITVVAVSTLMLLASGYAGSSFLLGRIAKARYDAALDEAGLLLDARKIVSRSYERGLFSSKARITFVVDVPAAAVGDGPAKRPAAARRDARATLAPLQLTLENEIQHGPLVGFQPAAALLVSRLTAVEGIDPAKRARYADVASPQVRTVFKFDGSYAGRLSWPAGGFDDAQLRMRWQALDYDFDVAASGARRQESLHWPGFRIDISAEGPAPGVSVSLDGINAQFAWSAPGGGHWLLGTGQGQGGIDRLAVVRAGTMARDAPSPLFSLSDLELDSRMSGDAAQLDIVQTVTGRGQVGATPIESIEFEAAIRRLDREALVLLQTPAVRSAQAGSIARAPDEATADFLQAIARLVEARPEYRTRLRATIEGQTGEFGAGVALHDAKPPGGATKAVPSPATPLPLVAQYLDGDLSLSLPKRWLSAIARGVDRPDVTPESVAALIAVAKGQGLLIEQAEAYVAELRFTEGQLLVNGKPPQEPAPKRR